MRNRESYVEMGKKGATAKWSKEPPFEARFWNRVDRKGPDDCWPWKKQRHPFGYGKAKKNGRYVSAHRIAFELANGRPPKDGFWVLHRCDNPPCCNPKHLYEGTPHQNNQDAISRGRYPKRHNRFIFRPLYELRKIDDSKLEEIRRRYSAGESQIQLAREFKIHQSTISRMVNNKRRFR